MDVLTWYSNKIPKANQWSNKQVASQLHDANIYENQVRGLAQCDIAHDQTAQHHTLRPVQSLAIRARTYAGSTEESWAYLEQLKLSLSFRRLILFSICLVLSEHGSSHSDLDALMWWTRTDEKKRKSILKGTKWVHQTILSLVGCGWSISRATELFFLVPLSNDRLIQLASKPSSGFAENLENPDSVMGEPFLTPSFTFPTLIEELCKGCDPPLILEQICIALGYRVLLPMQPFYQVSRCAERAQTGLRIEFFTPNLSVEAAAGLPEDVVPRKRRKQGLLPSPSSTTTHGIQPHDPLISEHSLAPSTEVAHFLMLVRHLRVESFEEDLLLLGIDAQYRWDEGGHKRAIDLKDTDLSKRSTTFFQDKEHLAGLLQLSVHHGLLRKYSESQKWIYQLSRKRGEILDSEDPYLDGLIFLCHICPRDEVFSQKFFATTKLLRPALISWFKCLLERPEVLDSVPSRDDLTAVCIAILKGDDLGLSHEAVLLLERLCVSEISVPSRLATANVQSTMLRRELRYDDSDRVVQKAISGIHEKIQENNIYEGYLLGQLYLSLAENSILRNEHTSALEWLNKISLSTEKDPGKVPTLMWRLFEQKWTTMGRTHRFIGDFHKAKEVLKPCLGIRKYLASNKVINIVRQLADVYVELGDFDSVRTLLDYHLELLHQKGREKSKPYHRLLLSYADADLRMGRFGSAQARLDDVKSWFEAHPPNTQTDQLDHVRTLIACMRIKLHEGRWSEVLERSTVALQMADHYTSFTATNHYKGYIRKVRAVSHLQLAQADMQAASKCVREPRHYMPGVGTYDRVNAQTELRKALGNFPSFDQTLLDIV